MSSNKISEKRRKIVLASAATPLAATLKSGAAMAASSAVCQPIVGDISNIKFASQGNSLGGDDDNAVRYPVETMAKKNPQGNSNYTSNSESKFIYKIEGTWYHHSGAVEYDLSQYEPHEPAYVLVLYGTDDQGTYEVGLWPRFQKEYVGDGRFPINASCLTSIPVSGNFKYTGM